MSGPVGHSRVGRLEPVDDGTGELPAECHGGHAAAEQQSVDAVVRVAAKEVNVVAGETRVSLPQHRGVPGSFVEHRPVGCECGSNRRIEVHGHEAQLARGCVPKIGYGLCIGGLEDASPGNWLAP